MIPCAADLHYRYTKLLELIPSRHAELKYHTYLYETENIYVTAVGVTYDSDGFFETAFRSDSRKEEIEALDKVIALLSNPAH